MTFLEKIRNRDFLSLSLNIGISSLILSSFLEYKTKANEAEYNTKEADNIINGGDEIIDPTIPAKTPAIELEILPRWKALSLSFISLIYANKYMEINASPTPIRINEKKEG